MSNPFAAPDAFDAQHAYLPFVDYSRYALWFCAVVYVLIGLLYGAFMPMIPFLDPEIDDEARPFLLVVTGGFGVFIFLTCAAVAAVNAAVAVGLARRAKWAWFGGLILGALYLPSGCLPFGALLFYALLQEDARKAFGV